MKLNASLDFFNTTQFIRIFRIFIIVFLCTRRRNTQAFVLNFIEIAQRWGHFESELISPGYW